VLATAAAAGSLAIGLNAVGAGAAQARNCDIGASACHGQVRAAAASDRIRYP
jgi:hypothetical protein